jgi:hypothetical protein
MKRDAPLAIIPALIRRKIILETRSNDSGEPKNPDVIVGKREQTGGTLLTGHPPSRGSAFEVQVHAASSVGCCALDEKKTRGSHLWSFGPDTDWIEVSVPEEETFALAQEQLTTTAYAAAGKWNAAAS